MAEHMGCAMRLVGVLSAVLRKDTVYCCKICSRDSDVKIPVHNTRSWQQLADILGILVSGLCRAGTVAACYLFITEPFRSSIAIQSLLTKVLGRERKDTRKRKVNTEEENQEKRRETEIQAGTPGELRRRGVKIQSDYKCNPVSAQMPQWCQKRGERASLEQGGHSVQL